MEIEFNPGRGPEPTGQPASRRPATPSAPGSALENAGALERKLNDIPLVRPDKIEAARAHTSDLKFPPDELLNGIANLLAMHINK
jgi:hypothetical protein